MERGMRLIRTGGERMLLDKSRETVAALRNEARVPARTR
jgi:hypothetical protein